MCCIVKHLLYLALVLNYLHYFVFSICRMSKYLLYLALVLNYIHCLVFSICCISKYLLYLAFLLNYVFNCQCGCAALQKTSYIWRLC